MASTEPDREPIVSEPRDRAGLRLRLWLGCLGGAVVAFVGLWWAAAPLFFGGSIEPASLITRLSSAAAAGLVVGALLALWLDRGIVATVRHLGRGIAARELARAPEARAWGELGDLSGALGELLQRHRHLARRSADYEAAREEIVLAREAVERWIRDERWDPLRLEEDATRELAETLNRGFTRRVQVDDQNRESARQIGLDLQGAAGDARESASQAERGFVEASALLTTVRELQRIGGDLAPAIAQRPARATAEGGEAWRGRAVEVIEGLIRASSESVEALGGALLGVQGVADRVQVLSNRATLIALNAVMAGTTGHGEAAEELKALAREVREATAQVEALTREIEERVAAASARMEAMRRSAADRLSDTPPASVPEAGARRAPEEAERLVERLRELVNEAAATGERLSAAGERASTSAERLVRRLADSVADLEGLVVRLSPPETTDGDAGREDA